MQKLRPIELLTKKGNRNTQAIPEIRKLKGAIKAPENFNYKIELTLAINQKYK